MISIKNLHAEVEGKPILRGVDLEIPDGEVHAIMGPNGSGKSTLASILAGREEYEVTQGSVIYKGQELLEMDPDERACEGVFLGFQYPVEIPGVSNLYLLRAALNARRKYRGEPEIDAVDFMQMAQEKIDHVGMSMEMAKRGVNEDFSGGEKKRNEIFQMLMLEPNLAILDETDSGLDIDALQVVADGVNAMRDGKRSFLVVTHYQRLLDYIVPDYVHVLAGGRIVKSGDKSLALELEAKGYGWLENEVV